MNDLYQLIKYMTTIYNHLVKSERLGIPSWYSILDDINYVLVIVASDTEILIAENGIDSFTFDPEGQTYSLNLDGLKIKNGYIPQDEFLELKEMTLEQAILSYGRGVIVDQKLLDECRKYIDMIDNQ